MFILSESDNISKQLSPEALMQISRDESFRKLGLVLAEFIVFRRNNSSAAVYGSAGDYSRLLMNKTTLELFRNSSLPSQKYCITL
jgi:hypothetical protein